MKYESELQYWMKCFVKEGRRFDNKHYADRCLQMAQEPDDTFLRDKVVADFGCGPRGSLAWTQAPAIRIGIDVLASTYINCFGQCMLDHNMIYVTSTETIIPIPSASMDVMFTMNAMDHVDDLSNMSAEVLRIMKPGGLFLGSFNLHEPATSCEPQTLTEELIRKYIAIFTCQFLSPGRGASEKCVQIHDRRETGHNMQPVREIRPLGQGHKESITAALISRQEGLRPFYRSWTHPGNAVEPQGVEPAMKLHEDREAFLFAVGLAGEKAGMRQSFLEKEY
ncbi:MAG: class I SAM-dependent methyltransferase [Desulfovibrio sp.]|nr:class I SAM-dependent methyltransferase [Desulfovibrio sp.]